MNRNKLSRDRSVEAETGSTRLPVLEEQLQVGIRKEETGRVRIVKKIHEEDVIVSGPVHNEDVQIERVPLHQYIDSPPQVRHEGDTMIIPVVKEEVVVQTRLVLVEEVRITKIHGTTTVEKPVTLRTEEVTIKTPEDQPDGSDVRDRKR